MDMNKKKLAFAVILLASTALIVYFTKGRGDNNDAVFKEEQVMLCVNPQCRGVFALTLGEIHEETAKIDLSQSIGVPVFVCPQCNQKKSYQAYRCPFCEMVFIPKPMARDFPDRCPKCRKSNMEEKRKAGQ